jgi:tellurite resistance protein
MLTAMFVIMVVGVLGSYFLIAGVHPKKASPQHLHPARRDEDLPKEPTLHSRVGINEQTIDEAPCKFFSLGIRGEVNVPADCHDINIQISIDDVTNGRFAPVLCNIEQFQKAGTSVFLYDEYKGKLPNNKTVLSDWLAVASIRVDTLRFPRKGLRKLQFTTTVISSQTKKELASSITTCLYDNPEFGYVELLRNSTRTKELTIPLAIALASIDGRPKDEEIKVIKQWMLENFNLQDGNKSENEKVQFEEKLEKALEQAVKFFTSGGRLEVRAVCHEVVKIAPAGLRLDIMRLLLNVAKADGIVTQPEMIVINKFAAWLQVERTKFRAMLEQVIPLSICQVKDADVLLGITADMDSESVCKYLNEEYRRWNSRVTNADAKIRDQAAKMLDLIAQARNTYTLESIKS